ncbi:uncharacterized protein LOC128203222 [Mya arenaria]|uniref:uncharacterized protein LOC128203222 n=1 Tax=Mya arenaria TaxID=6604 RepID=UPI0022E32186|nr:uncharacterized protein LOC128203222 [Mya arenaria]
MHSKLLCFSMLIYVAVVTAQTCNKLMDRFNVPVVGEIVGHSPIREINNQTSGAKCVLYCHITATCGTVEYDQSSKTCALFNVTMTPGDIQSGSKNIWYLEDLPAVSPCNANACASGEFCIAQATGGYTCALY